MSCCSRHLTARLTDAARTERGTGLTKLGMQRMPADIKWTPLKHKCGDVTDWGWSSRETPPPVFMAWCINVVGQNCPWHGGDTGDLPEVPASETIVLKQPNSDSSFYARQAKGDDIALGERLAGELQELMEKMVNDKLAVVKEIPPKYRKWLYANGYDPVDAWLDQRLADIVLNRGENSLPPELIDQID